MASASAPMRIVAVAVVIALASVPASAQVVPGRGASHGGITVVGRGTVLVAPDRARVSISIFGGVSGAQAGASVPLDDAAGALRDALVANGLADAHVVLPIGGFNTRNITFSVTGTLAKPTRERLEAIGRNVIKSLPDRMAPAFANAQVQVQLFADDCTPGETRAERAAYADARARAERLASTAGVRLGDVVAVDELQSFALPGCPAKPDDVETGPSGLQIGGSGPIGIPLTVTESVTFAIAGP